MSKQGGRRPLPGQNGRRLWTRPSLIVAISIVAALVGIGQSSAFWSEPDLPPPDSTTAFPIIRGKLGDPSALLLQTKAGPLTVLGTLDVADLTTVSQVNATDTVSVDGGSLCLNGDCITQWSELAGNYVHLSPVDPDLGDIEVVGTSADPASSSRIFPLASAYGALGAAAEPTPVYLTAGIVGWSFNSEVGISHDTYGAAGIAADVSYCLNNGNACTTDADCPGSDCVANSAGVWGSSGGFANAWAGRFDGRVGVQGDLCINGDCRDIFTIGEPGDSSGLVRVQQTSSPEFQTGLVQVEGAYRGGDIVLGQPLPSTSVLVTCGDGVCDYGGNGESPATCPADCS